METDVLAAFKERIEKALDGALPSPEASDRAGVLPEAMRYAVLGGGKRLRPLMVLAACRAAGGEPEQALPGALAVEFIHAYSLVHDDLPAMDDDDYRRGKPSCHKAYGEATAILVGDALLTLAFDVLAGPAESLARLRAVAELARAAGWRGLVGGQQLDLDAEEHPPETLEALERIHLGKTAALFEASAVLGGLLAEAKDEEIAALRRFGGSVGLAFQHIDDLLDAEHSTLAEQAAEKARVLLRRAAEAIQVFDDGARDGLEAILGLLETRLERAARSRAAS